MKQLDLRIDGAMVYDGSGTAPFRASVGVAAGRIVAIGQVDAPAARVIDAEGMALSPGFIDMHTHYDAQAFWDPALTPSSLFGVTTVLAGNCGFTIAPLNGNPADADYLMRMLARVEGMPLESLREGLPWDWRSFDDFLNRHEGRLTINAGFMVGHSAVRRFVMGERALTSHANDQELAQMKSLLRESLSAGGMGFSTTVSPSHNDPEGRPVPSRHASFDEIIALAAEVRGFEGTILELLPDTAPGLEAFHVELMIRMSLAGQRSVNWNVLRPDSRTLAINRRQLAACDRAAERGARIVPLVAALVDTMWLNFSSGFVLDMLPEWDAMFRLPPSERLAVLAKPEERQRLDKLAKAAIGTRRRYAEWEGYTLVEVFSEPYKQFQGRTVGEAARALGREPFDTLLDIVVADELRTSIAPEPAATDDASWQWRREVWLDSRTVVGASDAGAHLDMIDTFASPVKVLSEAVRERGVLSLQEAVRELTSVPAGVIGLRDRGRVAVGCHADLVLFDPATVGCGPVHTRFDMPGGAGRLYADPVGVRHVFVNGTEIACEGRLTGEKAGTVLRSGRDTCTVPLPVATAA